MTTPEPIYLTPDEIQQITGFTQSKRQRDWLRNNGFMQKKRADGTPLVARSHFNKIMGGGTDEKKRPPTEPDFTSLSA